MASQLVMEDSKVLGAIYLKSKYSYIYFFAWIDIYNFLHSDSVIEKVSLPMAKYVLQITPVVARRPSCPDDDSAVFYIKFQSVEGRHEVC